jgi:hypothetical protein
MHGWAGPGRILLFFIISFNGPCTDGVFKTESLLGDPPLHGCVVRRLRVYWATHRCTAVRRGDKDRGELQCHLSGLKEGKN